jgi:hypothetical protein
MGMPWAFLIQFAISGVAIVAMVALAGWARIAKPCPPLDDAAARRLLEDEFPDADIGRIWIAADHRAAVARSGDQALIVSQLGDGYLARAVPWSQAAAAEVRAGAVRLKLRDIAAPAISLAVGEGAAWPPALGAGA